MNAISPSTMKSIEALVAQRMQLASGGSFDQTLRTAGSKDELKEAASKLVSSALVLPVLQSLHESPWRPQSGAFAAGPSEKRFAPLLDQQFADRITQASNFGLIDSIVRRYEKWSGKPQHEVATA